VPAAIEPAPPPESAEDASAAEVVESEGEAPAAELDLPVEVVEVKVPGDRAVLVIPGETSTPIVYLHGKCGDPTAFRAWARVGRKFGTILSLVGDNRCKHSTRTQWTEGATAIDRRATKAIAAVEAALGIDLDEDARIAVGYSQGALKAEALATRFPKRYPRAVLIAGPRAPRDESLHEAKSVLLMAGDLDARDHLREAAKKLTKRGNRAQFVELPGARHGEYGVKAEPTMESGLSWLVAPPTS
jgi:predicted esterase